MNTNKDSEVQDTLDLSNQGIKKLNKAQPSHSQTVKTLILNGNELQRWDNIDSYPALTKLSATHNQLLRMYGVSRLHNLVSLDLSSNSILTIEGLKDLVNLKWLCLKANNIKTIEHLNTNVNIEYLDLSENNIGHISDISFLKNLKELLLHNNRICQLRQGERYLPPSLIKLTLATNNITDLNEISHLAQLINLTEFSIANNPCVNMTGNAVGFDYRPFIVNWCMSLKVIDGYMVDAIESLKAEWLYSQGKGRQFRPGEHQGLCQYLASVCPLSADALESEEDRKLRLILSKAQQHQQQLRDQLTVGGSIVRNKGSVYSRSQSSPARSPATLRRANSTKSSSPRRPSITKDARGVLKMDNMIASCHDSISNENDSSELMTRSLDPNLLFTSCNSTHELGSGEPAPVAASPPLLSSNHVIVESCSQDVAGVSSSGQLQAASKLVPVPESLMSPDYRPLPAIPNRIAEPKPTSSSGESKKIIAESRSSPRMARNTHPSPVLHPRSVDNQKKHNKAPCSSSKKKHSAHNHHHETMNSSDEDSEMSASKLETIKHRAQQKWKCKEASSSGHTDNTTERAAICIQKMWRGYRTRNLNKQVLDIYKDIEASRTQQYIEKLSSDMEATRVALESEHKLQILQMQAINALWKKVVSLQPGNQNDTNNAPGPSSALSDAEAFRALTETCSRLHSQVEQLQGSMQSIMEHMSTFCHRPCEVTATQTDIVAVHTPQCETAPFPYQRPRSGGSRPSSLPIPRRSHGNTQSSSDAPKEVARFATSLVDGVLRTVAEHGEGANDSGEEGGNAGDSGSIPNSGCAKQDSTDASSTLGTFSSDSSNGNGMECKGSALDDGKTFTKDFSECVDKNSTQISDAVSHSNNSCDMNSVNNNQQPCDTNHVKTTV